VVVGASGMQSLFARCTVLTGSAGVCLAEERDRQDAGLRAGWTLVHLQLYVILSPLRPQLKRHLYSLAYRVIRRLPSWCRDTGQVQDRLEQ
jgi:hypothetical protein